MYFAELSRYQAEEGWQIPALLMVGWLSREHRFAQGTVRQDVMQKLERLAVHGVHQMRGFHYCEFCREEEIRVSFDGESRRLGSAEIWVPGQQGLVYAAPTLVVHYIHAHGYAPPSEFIEAVESLDLETFNPDSLFDEVYSRREPIDPTMAP